MDFLLWRTDVSILRRGGGGLLEQSSSVQSASAAVYVHRHCCRASVVCVYVFFAFNHNVRPLTSAQPVFVPIAYHINSRQNTSSLWSRTAVVRQEKTHTTHARLAGYEKQDKTNSRQRTEDSEKHVGKNKRIMKGRKLNNNKTTTTATTEGEAAARHGFLVQQ